MLLSVLTLHHPLLSVNLCKAAILPTDFSHVLQVIFFGLFLPIFILPSPSLLPNSLMQSLSPIPAPPPALPSPPPVSLIVLFSAEGYSCLQGYENVKKAHSIFSYVNSHFPPEQTHFPGPDLPRCTSHFPPFSLHYLSTIVRGKMKSTPSLLICHFDRTSCHRPLYSSLSSFPFKQSRLVREKLCYINSKEITLLSINTQIQYVVIKSLFSREALIPSETLCDL